MKAVLILALLGCLIAVSLAATRCTKQSDCGEDECCLDTMFFKSPFCEKRYKAGQRCVATSLYKPEKDMFYFACPCEKMYECLGKGVTENGVTFMKNPKCIMPTM
ncbi:LOW QUALITY PROTEIN: toxin CSTX-20-like [Stegodyphus dumicola]|uniref:LOW QUALITY PROTEIN: toxin CSTX-20-like n=1 Tax=Stegodyphus dumicola TaxID=202533 RepID=UPI0015A871FB|nr:LOW QUALITY PROTEIN: toxin CSTX-20-like [Stegodyphus dumicola]